MIEEVEPCQMVMKLSFFVATELS
jgi:hypothetical protein